MFKKILLALGLVVLFLVVVGLFLPQHYTVSRSVSIKSDKAHIHALCSDLARWPEWTPWEKMDPTMKRTLGPITAGVGASQTWTSDSHVERLTLTESDVNTGIAFEMVFVNGDHETPARGRMTYTQRGDSVDVGWSMEGEMEMPIVGGYFALLSNRMIGSSFEEGLDQLKSKAEAASAATPAKPAVK